MSKPNAWVTLATNDGYAIGALVLAHSLRKVATAHKIHIIYTDGVTPNMLHQLQSTFDDSTLVNVLDSKDEANLALIQRPDLGVTFTKLHCWLLTQYAKCVFLDADTLVIRNADELFERPEITAAPDMGWPDYFNSGVFVFEPSEETYHKLVGFGLQYGSFDGGDQGLLNLFFSNWRELDARHRLPLIYNLCASVVYTYMAALKRHGDQVKIVHFLGAQKPWLKGGPTPLPAFWALWFAIYDEKVRGTVPSDINPAYIDSTEFPLRTIPLLSSFPILVPLDKPEIIPSRVLAMSGLSSASNASRVLTPLSPPPSNVPIAKSTIPIISTQAPHVHKSKSPSSVAKLDESSKSILSDTTKEIESLTSTVADLAINLSAESTLTIEKSKEEGPTSDERRQAWEQGRPDYQGRDAFDNIMKAIEKSLS